MIVFSHDDTGYHVTDTSKGSTTTYKDRDQWIGACLLIAAEAGKRVEEGLARLQASYERTPATIEAAG